MSKKTTNDGKIPFIRSIGFKIALLVVVASLISTAISVAMFTNLSRSEAKRLVENNIGDLATSYSKLVNYELSQKEALEYDDYNSILADVKIKGMDSSYAYLVTSDGVMQYHPTVDKVGNPVENEVVKGLVAELSAGKTPADAVVTYLYKGANKIAGYSILSDRSILVVTADEDDAYAFMSEINRLSVGLIIAIIVIFSAAGVGFAMVLIIKPMNYIVTIVNETADFDFASKNRNTKMLDRKDEIGSIGQAMGKLRANLRGMVGQINGTSETLGDKVTSVASSSVQIDNMCTDTSSTTEQLAAGMQETTASTETIQGNIEVMQDEAREIKQLTADGEKQSEDIKARAESLNETTKNATTRTTSLYNDMKAKTEKAIADSQAVSKINELTDAIMAISNQTSLLALNANIEAARAGEAGKGFAVVATEIGTLASQTSDTVGSINEIVGVVNEVVSRMADTLTESINFLENVVIKDYEQFSEVSVQYKSDADLVKNNMENIEGSIVKLTSSIEMVADSLQGIANTIGEATLGVTDIAGKTSDITSMTADNKYAVDECLEALSVLKGITDQFTL